MTDSAQDIPLRVAQNVVDIMNEAADLDGSAADKATFLLHKLQQLLNRKTYTNLLHLEDLRREPAPLVLQRLSYAASPDLKPIQRLDALQDGLNQLGPVVKLIMPWLLAHPRTPTVVICAEDARDREWVEKWFRPTIRAAGYEDIMTGAWAACHDRAVTMSIMRRTDTPPFTNDDRRTMSLMLRAVAPFVDRRIFADESPLDHFDLTGRQREVLLLLLAGDTEKQIAAELHRSVHTVHTFVKQLYDKFSVSSRGELMAHFIDESIATAAREWKHAVPPSDAAPSQRS